MAIASNFPAISPSLSLNFAQTKRLDPRITFTRASTGRYYDGVTVAKAEENLFTRSQEFDTGAAWAATNVTVAGNTADTTAPDGTSTAEKLTITGGSNAHAVSQSTSILASTYTVSIFAKKGTQFYFRFGRNTGASFPAPGTWWWDLDAGTFNGTLGSGWTNQSITSVGNDWYRCVVSVTATAAGTDGISVSLTDNAGNNIFSADNNTFYIWGAQLEQRSAVTAYTATTTQPITNYIPVLLAAPAGVARFDHVPTTGVSQGLLIEEQRTNSFLQSEDFTNATWGIKTNITLSSNTVVAPDGALTGEKLIANTTNGGHLVGASNSLDRATTRTISIFLKAAEYSIIRIQDNAFSSNFTRGFFNISTLTASTAVSGNGVASNASITPVGNGWYRCSYVSTPNTVTGGTSDITFAIVNTDTNIDFAGNDFDGIFIWGAQLEVGAFPTSYIPTTTTALTRNADVANMTGTNFSSWYRADEGTLYSEASRPFAVPSNLFPRTFEINDGTANNSIRNGYSTATNASFVVVDSTVNQAALSPSATVSLRKLAGAYKVDDFAASVNGSTVSTDTSGTIPVVDRAVIGSAGTSAFLNGTIRRLAFYPVRLSDAQLVALTG